MRENTDQKNSEYGHFSRSVVGFFFPLSLVCTREELISDTYRQLPIKFWSQLINPKNYDWKILANLFYVIFSSEELRWTILDTSCFENLVDTPEKKVCNEIYVLMGHAKVCPRLMRTSKMEPLHQYLTTFSG